jgi:excisionase family DNA binding protein
MDTLQQDSPADVLLKAEDIAAYFNVSLPRAYAIMASGKIPVVRIGRSVRVSRRELEKWIQEQSQRSLAA